MFTQEETQKLEQELQPNRIKTRTKGNTNLSYLEGFDVIETANSIFGYGNWSYSIANIEHISQETNQNENIVIGYKAIVKIVVHNNQHTLSVTREDIGYGTGISKTLADAHEGAGKEAVTDALKRGLKSFGNQFGLSLYDKSRNQPQATSQNQTSYSQNQSQRTNKSQNHTPTNQATPPPRQQPPQRQSQYDPYEYESLNRIGLEVLEDNGFLIISGDDQFSKKDSIKACGFRFDGASKTWYKALNQAA